MDFSLLQNKMMENAINYGKNYNVKIDEDFALIKLYEEVGELSQAILVHRKKSRPVKHLPFDESKQKVAEELTDVLGMVVINAKLMGVDLEEEVKKKWINNEK